MNPCRNCVRSPSYCPCEKRDLLRYSEVWFVDAPMQVRDILNQQPEPLDQLRAACWALPDRRIKQHHTKIERRPMEGRTKWHLPKTAVSALSSLDARSREILLARNGSPYAHPCTLQQLADAMNLTRERIRQIEKRALGRLCADLGEVGTYDR